MVAHSTASLELACKIRDDLAFIPSHQILERADVPFRFETQIKGWAGKTETAKRDLIPDGLFGLEYWTNPDDRRYRFFALEIDRGTKPNRLDQAKEIATSIAPDLSLFFALASDLHHPPPSGLRDQECNPFSFYSFTDQDMRINQVDMVKC